MKVSLGESRATDDSTGLDLWQNRPVEFLGRVSSSLQLSLSDSKNLTGFYQFSGGNAKRLISGSRVVEQCVSGIRIHPSLIRRTLNLALQSASLTVYTVRLSPEWALAEVRTGERRDSLARSVTPISVSRTIDFGGDRDQLEEPPQAEGDLDLPESRRTRLEGRPPRTPTGGRRILCGSGGGERSPSTGWEGVAEAMGATGGQSHE